MGRSRSSPRARAHSLQTASSTRRASASRGGDVLRGRDLRDEAYRNDVACHARRDLTAQRGLLGRRRAARRC